MWLLAQASGDVNVLVRFGAWELAGSREAFFSAIASAASAAALAVFGIWAIALKGWLNASRTYHQILLAFIGMVIVSNVLSPQYMVWAIPLVMLIAIEVAPQRVTMFGGFCVLLALLTTVSFPIGMRYFSTLPPWLMMTLVARNLLLVAVFAWLTTLTFRGDYFPGGNWFWRGPVRVGGAD